MFSLSRESTWESGIWLPGALEQQPLSGGAKGSFFFHQKAYFRSFKELRKKRSIVLRSCFVSLPSDQLDSRNERAISAWISLLQSPSKA